MNSVSPSPPSIPPPTKLNLTISKIQAYFVLGTCGSLQQTNKGAAALVGPPHQATSSAYFSHCRAVLFSSHCRTVLNSSHCKTVLYSSQCKTVLYSSHCKTVLYSSHCKTVLYFSHFKAVLLPSHNRTYFYSSPFITVLYPRGTIEQSFTLVRTFFLCSHCRKILYSSH